MNIMCEECGWTGDPSERHCSDEDESHFIYCPDCGKTDCFEDLEDEEPT